MTEGKWERQEKRALVVELHRGLMYALGVVICGLAAGGLTSALMSGAALWIQLSFQAVLTLAFAVILVEVFWVHARTRMEMFVVSNWSQHGRGRTTYVKLNRSEFFLPPGQEMVIRHSPDNDTLQVMVGENDETEMPRRD